MLARNTLLKLMLILVIGLTMTTLIGCKKKAGEKVSVKEKKAEEQIPAKTAEKETQPAKALTDDDFVEYWAQITYIQGYLVGEKYAKDPVKASKVLADEMGKLEKKFGMTGEQLGESFSAWMTEWTKKAMSEPEKYNKQWEEINKRLEKRIEELKKGK